MSITSIWNLLNNQVNEAEIKRGIEIPMIQRDYAQGRNNNKANEIRKVFLNNISIAINDYLNRDKQPMELDFIYGYIDNETFIPLDGQQRLTTLYLLHWYFAFKEKLLTQYKVQFSRFNYQTRQSAKDFFKKLNEGLSAIDHADIFTDNKSFSTTIKDKNWYFVSWNYDMTIQSALTMLDEIHDVFKITEIKLTDLINENKSPIVFNFLDINNFVLSDDLYIKMNSRGKPLTSFENLKAELGKFIELSDFNESYNFTIKHSEGCKPVNVENYFVTMIDTSWADYFWKIRNKKTNEFDDKLINLFAFVSLNEVVKESLEKFDKCIKDLDENNTDLSYFKFKTLELLNENATIFYINTLDLLVENNGTINTYLKDGTYIEKSSIIESAFLSNFKARYEDRILFYAIMKFLIQNKNHSTNEELNRWDRLLRNLVKNTIYNSSKDYQDSILAIDLILQHYNGDIYQTFLSLDIKGFDSQQIKEEKLKIGLILTSDKWKDLIIEAESHLYLNGQVIFLLAFSGIFEDYLNNVKWTKEEELVRYNNINSYFNKFKVLFSETGLRQFKNELFRRALLAKGDYLVYSTNWSLIIDKHRDISWKRLFKETGNKNSNYNKSYGYLKELFDELDADNVENSLKQIVKAHNSTDWRKKFIDNPILLDLSYEKYLKFFGNGDIYILRKTKYNKYADPELNSVLLRADLKKKGFEEKDIELGYIDTLNRYGIVRLKKRKPKIIYNFNDNNSYMIRQKGVEDLFFKKRSEVVSYIISNF